MQILEQGLVLFLNHEPWFFLWSKLAKPNLTGLDALTQLTATSCNINTVSPFFSGIQARRAETPPISLRRLVEGSMRVFFKRPVIMSRTSPISSLRILVTRTSPSCSTRTPSSPTLWFSHSRKTPQAKVRGVWSYSSFEACFDDPRFPWHQRSHFAQYTFIRSLPRNVTLPLIYFSGFTGTWNSTTLTSSGATSTRVPSPQLETCSRIQSFQHLANRFCGDLVRWRSRIVSALGFSSCQSVHMNGSHGCYKFDNTALGFGPRGQTAHLPVFLHLRTTNLPIPNSIRRSEQAQQRFERRHNKHERMRRRRTWLRCCSSKSCECHSFSFLVDHLWVTRGQLFRTTLMLGRFASSLCRCLCLCQQGLARTGQSPRRDSQALCLTSNGRVVFSWFSNSTSRGSPELGLNIRRFVLGIRRSTP